MTWKLLWLLVITLGLATLRGAEPERVVVIPVREEINEAQHYILRRGLKEAAANHAVVILDMKTPGGSAATALEIMEALGKFQGKTITFVNPEAMSAGAFIAAATEEIWFAPEGVIGAAAAINSDGQDIPETLRLKLNSFLRAKIRAISEGKGYRGDVVSAMIDKDFELKIGEKVIKPKGELLSLTATEAMKTYGDPAKPLLAAGVAKDVDDLIAKQFPGAKVTRLEVTWSEHFAVWLQAMSPLLLGLGVLALFIEFKTPGFGIFGISGIVLLGLVFLGSYAAGLSGHEPILVFALGVVLVALELVFFHSAGFLGVGGIVLMLGSLVWAMADVWPTQPVAVPWSADVFVQPLTSLGLGLMLAAILAAALWRFLPRGWFFERLVVSATVGGAAQIAGGAPQQETGLAALLGQRGVAVTALRPSGQVEILGRRYEAKVSVGAIDAGSEVVVRGRTDFGLVVEKGTT